MVFPGPFISPVPPWLHPRPAHAGAVAGTAAAVAAGVTWIAVPPHHGVPPAGAATPGVTGSADPALGHDGQPGTPRARCHGAAQRAADGRRQFRCRTPGRGA